MRPVEWTAPALEDMASLDNSVAVRVKEAVERFAQTGAGNLKALRGMHPPEFRLRVGDWRVRFQQRAAGPQSAGGVPVTGGGRPGWKNPHPVAGGPSFPHDFIAA